MTVANPPLAVQSSGATNNADDFRAALMAPLTGAGLAQNPRPRGGIVPGYGKELSVAASGTPAMNVVVGSGTALIPTPQDGHGGWWVVNDGDLTLTISTANATNPRTDLVIARVADPQYTAGGDGLAAIKVITGVAGVGAPAPAVPSTEGPYQVLGQIAVAALATSVTNANITLNTNASRAYTVAAGAILPVANAAARTALFPYEGLHVYQMDTDVLWVWANAAWSNYAPIGDTGWLTTGITLLAGWSTLSGTRYRKQGNRVRIEMKVTKSGATLTGNFSNTDIMQMPVGFRHTNTDFVIWAGDVSAGQPVVGGCDNTGTITAWGTGAGLTIASGDVVRTVIEYTTD